MNEKSVVKSILNGIVEEEILGELIRMRSTTMAEKRKEREPRTHRLTQIQNYVQYGEKAA